MKGLIILLIAVTLGERGRSDELPVAITCDETGNEPATKLAVQYINKNHHHGYKFRFSQLRSSEVLKEEPKCRMNLKIELQETVCHVLDPKPFEECEVRSVCATQVKADCNVTISIAPETTTALSYVCNTEPMDRATLSSSCADAPLLRPLNYPDGLANVNAAVATFNREGNHSFAFKLLEVGRLKSAWVMGMDERQHAEFVIIETDCPAKARIDPQNCRSLCPERARHGLCESTMYKNKDVKVKCDIYKAKNPTQQSGTDPKICLPYMGHGPGIHPSKPPHHMGHGPVIHPTKPPHHMGHGPAKHPPHHMGHGPVIRPTKPPHHMGHGPVIHPTKPPHHMGHGPVIHPTKPPHHMGHGPVIRPTKPPHHMGHGPVIHPTKPPHHMGHGPVIHPTIPVHLRPLPFPVDHHPVILPFDPCHGFEKRSTHPICPFPPIPRTPNPPQSLPRRPPQPPPALTEKSPLSPH